MENAVSIMLQAEKHPRQCCEARAKILIQALGRLPMKKDTAASIRKTRNRIFAIPTADPAMPPKPSTAAIMAMTKKVTAQLNMMLSRLARDMRL